MSRWKERLAAWDRWGGWWPERVASLLALSGVLFAVLSGFKLRQWQGSGSDIKTVYAASWCVARGLPAYGFADLARVFDASGVVQPSNWYAHAPVYPPFTLALMSPLTLVPMVPAIYLWVIFSGLLMAAALTRLVRYAGEQLGLNRVWRLAIIGLVAASPLLSFGLEMGNVSVPVSALCFLAVLEPGEGARQSRLGTTGRIVALALALLLKPHLALWILVGQIVLHHRPGRARALWAMALAGGAALLLLLVLAGSRAGTQVGSYRTMLGREVTQGSMSSTSRDLIGVAAQITSLDSLLGYGLHAPGTASVLAVVLVGIMVVCLFWATRKLATDDATRLLLLGAWVAVGMVATYHRAADATVLLILLPWLTVRLRRRWWDAVAWATVAFSVVMSCEISWEFWEGLAQRPGFWHLARLMLYRQSATGALLLACLLVGTAALEVRRRAIKAAASGAQVSPREQRVGAGERRPVLG